MSDAVKRATKWRKELIGQGYKQKAFLLSPQALKDLDKLKKEHGTELEAVEQAIRAAARAH